MKHSKNLPRNKRALLRELLLERQKREKRGIFPLSEGQKALWFEQQLNPSHSAFNLSGAWKLRTPVERAALKKSFEILVDRHSILKTTYRSSADSLMQKIEEGSFFHFEETDAKLWSEEELLERLRVEAAKPFSLEKGPLLRVHIFSCQPEQEDVLLLSLHHIVVDAWSLVILLDELKVVYSAVLRGQTPSLPPIQKKYQDFVRWQQRYLQSQQAEEDLRYWKKELSGERPILDLPADFVHTEGRTYAGDVYHFKLDAELTRRLKDLAAQEGVTLYTVLLSLYHVLLYRYSGQQKILIGTFMAGRTVPEFQDVVGYFVNPVVIGADFSDNPSFREGLKQTQLKVLKALEHQNYPFILLVEKLRSQRENGLSSLFQAAFVMESAHRFRDQSSTLFVGGDDPHSFQLGELNLITVNLPQQTAQFDLTLMVEEADHEIYASFIYNRDLFKSQRMKQMSNHFMQLALEATKHPLCSVGSLPILTSKERERQLVEWNQRDHKISSEQLMHHLLEKKSLDQPEKIAATFYEQSITYRELNEKANQLARYLRKLGVGMETKVGIQLNRSLEMLVAVFGVLKSGGCYVPIDPAYPEERKEYILRDSECEILILDQNLSSPLVEIKKVYLAEEDDKWQQEETTNLDVDLNTRNLAYMIYTSGSTGEPKGVLVEHRGIQNLAEAQKTQFDLEPNSQILQFSSFSFDAWVFECVMAIYNGATLHFADKETLLPGPDLVRFLEEKKITHVTLPPSILSHLPDAELPDLQVVIVAGEACSPEIVKRWGKGRKFFNAYGPTEATVWVTVERCDVTEDKPLIGRPIQNVECFVLNDCLEPVPVGIVGELYVGGIGLARGYHNRPALNKQRFIQHPFANEGSRLYRTGDLARWLPDGRLDFVGRIDDQVKVRGLRIELGEIKRFLDQHPLVLEGHVDVRVDQQGTSHLVAYVVPESDKGLDGDTLKAYLATKLPTYYVPSAFVFLHQIPLTVNGKVDWKQLPNPFQETDLTETVTLPPITPTEKSLADLWSKLLQRKEIGRKDDFFQIGGHSLLASQLASRINEQFSVQLPVSTIFEYPCLENLAQRIEEERKQNQGIVPTVSLTSVSRDAPLPVTHAQQRMWFLNQLEPDNPAYHIPGQLRLTGQLDLLALKESFRALVKRHEALRTVFRQAEGEVVQIIRKEVSLDWEEIDLTLDRVDKEEQLQEHIRMEARRPFDLQAGPLLRVKLIQLGAKDYLLLLTVHHIVADGWSMGVLVRELSSLYNAFRVGKTDALPPLNFQYPDFAVWQREWLERPEMASQLEYWKKKLSGNIPVLELPVDFKRPEIQTYRGDVQRLVIPLAQSKKLKELAKNHQATLFMLLLSAFKVLLHRWTGVEDIAVGTPVAGRNQKETENMIGLFVNTLVLRTDLCKGSTFAEVLARVRSASIDAFAHQDVAFEKLVELLQPVRDLQRPPLFQVMFNMLNMDPPSIALDGVEAQVLPVDDPDSKYDLTLYAEEKEGSIHCELVYNADLFSGYRMREFLQQYQLLLDQITEDAHKDLGDYSLVTPAARELLPDPKLALNEAWQEAVHEKIAHQAQVNPNRIAIQDRAAHLSYGDLDREVNRVAHYLLAHNLVKGEVVAVFSKRSAALVSALLGTLKAGLSFAILDSARPPTYLARQVEIIQPQAFIIIDEPELPSELASAIGSQLKCKMTLYSNPQQNKAIADYSSEAPAVKINADDTAYLAFTSGTTGEAKAVIGTHGPLAQFVDWQIRRFQFTEQDRFSMLSGLGYDPLLRDLFTPLSAGATVCIPGSDAVSSPSKQLHWMEREGITVTHLTPALGALMAGNKDEGIRLYHLRYLFFGGDHLNTDLVSKMSRLAPKATCVNFYGTTETPQAVGYHIVSQELSQEHVPVGQGRDGVQLLVLNDQKILAGIGEVGEVYVRTPYLTKGYIKDPTLTRDSYLPNPFTNVAGDLMYRTGDLGRFTPKGDVELIGRKDELVNIRGYRIHPNEVKKVLEEHPAVEQSFVHVKRYDAYDQRLVAYVVFKKDAAISAQELRNEIRNQLPEPMVPDFIVPIDLLPVNPNGKIDQQALPNPLELQQERQPSSSLAQTDIEQIVASIFAEVLQLQVIGRDDNFFDLGGHSLLLLSVHEKLQDRLAADLSMVDLFKFPTVRQLAASIEHRDDRGVIRGSEQIQERVQQRRQALHSLRQKKRRKR